MDGWKAVIIVSIATVAVVLVVQRKKNSRNCRRPGSLKRTQSAPQGNVEMGNRARVEVYLNEYCQALTNLFYEQKLAEYVAFHFSSVPQNHVELLKSKIGSKELSNQAVPDEILSDPLYLLIMEERIKKNMCQYLVERSADLQNMMERQVLLEAHQKVLLDLLDFIQNEDEKMKWQSVWDSPPTSFRV